MRIDLNLVEVFCCVYEEGGFSRAAEKLGLSQPTVSGHIKNLEECIGTRLLDRLPRRTVPTRAGRILYRRGRAILDERTAAIQDLRKFLNRIEGSLVISSSTISGDYLLPPIIASFHSRYPAVRIELRISDSSAVCDEVLSGKTELGFVGAKLEAVGLEFHFFASDELVLVVPNNAEWDGVETITLKRLAEKPFLAREAGSGTRQNFEKKVGRTVDEFNVVGTFSSTSAVKEAIKAGLGISVLSLLAVKSEIASGALKSLKIDGLARINREFYAVVNKNLTLSPIAAEFLNCALADPAKKASIQVSR